MYEKILIGEKEMEFKASAATPILYKKLFKDDLFLRFNSIAQIESKVEKSAEMTEVVSGLGYVMNCEATMTADELFSKLNTEQFYKWLLEIEPNALAEKSVEIIQLYKGNQKTENKSKNA